MRHLAKLMALAALFAATSIAALDLRLTRVVDGLVQPIFVTHAGDGSGRLFIVEQGGRIRIARGGVLLPTPFLDIANLVSNESEQGLLGLAFPVDYEASGRFYVNYTDLAGDSVVARLRVSGDPDRADRSTLASLLNFDQPFANHNGGWLSFGPDGLLYVATGDGGSGNDPQNHGQRLDTVLGKILRLDVSGATAAVPASNPFVNTNGARPEIWAFGLRNPWRPSFDRSTGELWIADVGQSRLEEINLQAAGLAGQNYGWRVMEGSECSSSPCTPVGILPVNEYGRASGCSVTGGYVYRGTHYPAMVGRYLFSDFCSGTVWSLQRNAPTNVAASFTRTQELASGRAVSSFGEDEPGNLYLVDYNGEILLISDGPPVIAAIDASYTGSWYDPAQSGHGFFIEILPGNQMLAWWFTFSPDGQQSWFGGVGTISGNTVTINPVRTTGGRFIPNFNSANVTHQPFGTMTFTFGGCRNGRVDFNFPDGYGQGTMNLTRLTIPEAIGCVP